MKFAQRGFTLPELLVAGGIIALLLLGGAFLLSSKANVDEEQRDAQRRIDVAEIALSFKTYMDASGQLPSTIGNSEQFIGNNDGEFNLCSYVVPKYANDLPFDPFSGAITESVSCPKDGGVYSTGYSIMQKDGLVTIAAPFGETDQDIKIDLDYTNL